MTVKSPKDLFFPQSEDLMAFRVSGKSIEIENPVLPTEPFVLFGVRACDARSFDVLDRVFLSEPVDSYYEARRNCGTVVSLGCLEPLRETCFCSVFGIDLAEPEGDVQAWVLGDEMYLNARTKRAKSCSPPSRTSARRRTARRLPPPRTRPAPKWRKTRLPTSTSPALTANT